MNSISYPAVTGLNSKGREITVQVGDLAGGTNDAGQIVYGRVVATHPYYPSLTVDNYAERLTLRVDQVELHLSAQTYVGQSA